MLKPRCSPCRHSHVKCVYESSSLAVFEFRDETEHVKTHSRRRGKKRKLLTDADTPRPPSPPQLSKPAETCSQNDEMEYPELSGLASLPNLDTTSMPWMDGLFDSNLDQRWDFTPYSTVLWNTAANPTLPNHFPGQSRGMYSAGSSGKAFAELNMPNSDHQSPSSSSLSAVSDPVLAQHYTQNLTSKYTSKEQGWSYHTYFFNRFNSSHPFVVSSLYAWTAAHLFCNETLSSEANAIEHYAKSLSGLGDQLGVHLLVENIAERASQAWFEPISQREDLDAVAVTLYFLAWTDLLLSRQASFRRMLRLEAALLDLRGHDQSNSIYVRMAVWFCFLDARAALFSQGNDRIIQSLGDDSGLMAVVEKSHNFLQKEYCLLYPEKERRWDEAHRPLYVATCRLVALLGKVSRSASRAPDESREGGVRVSLCEIGRVSQHHNEKKRDGH